MTCTMKEKNIFMSQYNNKIVLQNVLEMLDISRECAENDLVLKFVITQFQSEVELFDFSDTDYFDGYEDREEILKGIMKILVRKTYEILEDKMLVEDKEDSCIIRIGRIVDTNGYSHYINHLEWYKVMLLDMDNRMIKKFLAAELYYDKNNKTVSYKNQEIIPFHCEDGEFEHKILASIDTTAEEYDARKKWIKSAMQYYYGEVQDRGIRFFDKLRYQNEITVSLCGEKVKVSYELFDKNTHKKVKERCNDFDLKYRKVYDDYITGKIFPFHHIEQEINENSRNTTDEKENITLSSADLLEETAEIPSDYRNSIGSYYCLDDYLQEAIKLELCINNIENIGKKYKRKKR